MTKKEVLKKEAREYILSIINKHEPITKENEPELLIFIKSVSRSGMSRNMIVLLDNINITYYINDLLGYSNKSDYVRVGGCGMDMTFWLADTITYYLYTTETQENDNESLGKKKTIYNKNYPSWLTGNGGGCLKWRAIY